MTTYEPPAEAVEAAAKAIHANDFERGLVAEDVWGDLTDETREWYVANATAALTAAGPLIAAQALREAAQWLAATNYPIDWQTDAPAPDPLWEALVDVVHEDENGRWHDNELTREAVADWLAEEAGRVRAHPAPIHHPRDRVRRGGNVSGYIPTRRDKIGVPIVNFVARLLLTKEFQKALKHATAVGIAVNRISRKEADDDR